MDMQISAVLTVSRRDYHDKFTIAHDLAFAGRRFAGVATAAVIGGRS